MRGCTSCWPGFPSPTGDSARPSRICARRCASSLRLTAARNDLAWILATAADASLRNPEEAVQLAESIGSVDQLSSANQLDTLAAAYAAAGRRGDAVRAAERALALAQREDAQLARQIESRLREYRRGRAWVEPLPASAAAGPGADPSTQR